MDRDALILQEVATRAQQRLAVADLVSKIKGELFPQQRAVADDPAKEVAALCPRRAGKTNLWSRVGVCIALERPRCIIRIWCISLQRAKQLLFNEIVYLCARHKIEVQALEATGVFKFPNGSEIRLLGADKQKEAEKKRGDKTAAEIVVESQLFGPYLQQLVEDIAGPCLADLNGTFYLEGTPGPICAGHWFSVSGGNDFSSRWISPGRTVQGTHVGAGWSCHRWSALDNPHLPHFREWLAKKKLAKRWKDDDPTYVREYLGRWVNDFDSLFYSFDPIRNTFVSQKPVTPWGPGWTHTIGWDLGFRDDMALVAWGYHPSLPNLYEAFSWKKPGASMDEVMDQVIGLQRTLNFTKYLADTGGGGKMFVEEALKRYPIPWEPANKKDKYDHVRFLNDDLRGGFVQLAAGSPYALEMAELPRKNEPDEDDKEEKAPKEDPRFANHCCDAGLYAYRGAMHYLHRDEPPKIQSGTQEWFKAEEARIIANIEQKKARAGKVWLERYDEPASDFLEDE